jgi:tRNA(His) 5'-end guanylyltransferase
MVSTLSALASAYFNRNLEVFLPDKMDSPFPTFDSRVWAVPNQTEAANCFLWRVQDAVKNSVSMAAQQYYSHNELLHKHSGEMQEMLFQKGVNWNDYPPHFKEGVFVQRHDVYRTFSSSELLNLPEHHIAHKNPELQYRRSEVRVLLCPPFNKVVNREGVIFRGEAPKTEREDSVYEEVIP